MGKEESPSGDSLEGREKRKNKVEREEADIYIHEDDGWRCR